MFWDKFMDTFVAEKGIVYIYALCEYGNDEDIRYIGKANNPIKRFKRHLTPYEKEKNNHRTNWINKVLESGVKPNIIIIEEANSETWDSREKYWIKYYRELKYDLVNECEGGQGGGRKLSEKEIEHLRLCNLGRKASEESRKKMSQSHLGTTPTEDTKKKMSESKKGISFSQDTREKISLANTGSTWQRGGKRLVNSSSHYVGVSYSKKPKIIKRWRAYITFKNKYISLGTFEYEEHAAYAYNNAAIKYFGLGAILNNISMGD